MFPGCGCGGGQPGAGRAGGGLWGCGRRQADPVGDCPGGQSKVGAMAVETTQPLRDPEIVVLARSLLERRQELADGMAERIQREVDFYRSGAVSLDELRAS